MLYGEKTRYWLWLSLALRSCSKRFWDVLERFGFSAEKFYKAFLAGEAGEMNEKDITALNGASLRQADAMLQYCVDKGYKLICFEDEEYPQVLASICNPPFVLFCMGHIELLGRNNLIAVVGTRNPSEYGKKCAAELCGELAREGYVIVSGFALGIDSISHRTALKKKEPTIAVLGCGIEYPYPKENVKSKEYIAKSGLFVSEYPPSSPPDRWCFPQRNRILSGLCAGTLVIEGGKSSGSLVTATYAVEQGRDVFCVPPHDIFDEQFRGNVKLLRSGAIPVFEPQDIIDELNLSQIGRLVPPKQEKKPEKKKKASSEKAKEKPAAEQSYKYDFSSYDAEKRSILEALAEKEQYVDELSLSLDIPISELFLALTELEIDGAVEAMPGNRYSLLLK